MKFICIISSLLIMVSSTWAQKPKCDYISPVIGAYAPACSEYKGYQTARTFPGPTTPFGLVQLSPDTYTGGDNGNGYSWFCNTIEGFSFTHMSGIGWYGDLGNFLVMPTTGKLFTNKGDASNPENGYRSHFSHDTEIVEAGYYAVTLDDYNIRAELTAAPRSGMLRFTFPESENARIQIDLARRVGGTSVEQYVKIVDENTIKGWMKCTPEGGGWGNGNGKANYTVYFYCQFSKPFSDYGIWNVNIPDNQERKLRVINTPEFQDIVSKAAIIKNPKEFKGKHAGFFANFKTAKDEQVIVKSGISFVSVDGAKNNLENDIPHWDFDKVVSDAKLLWDDAIQTIHVEGATEREKEIFYTAMYRTMIDPRSFSDADGQYIGADNKVHKNKKFTYRTIFSGWDVFRSQFPLQTIISPSVVNDEINSLLQMSELSGREYLPRWEFLNSYSGCMVGNPAVSVIVDAYEKGIRNYDIEKAFQYSKNSVDTFGNGLLGYTPNSISKTLEYAYTDWCVGQFASSLEKIELAKEYFKRSENYKNLWNEEVSWFRSKDQEGNWMKWKGKTVHGQGCVESNPYQQGWFVPHDIPGLTELMGGLDSIQNELVNFFEKTPDNFLWNSYYNHPNEPVHHIPFIFNQENSSRLCLGV